MARLRAAAQAERHRVAPGGIPGPGVDSHLGRLFQTLRWCLLHAWRGERALVRLINHVSELTTGLRCHALQAVGFSIWIHGPWRTWVTRAQWQNARSTGW